MDYNTAVKMNEWWVQQPWMDIKNGIRIKLTHTCSHKHFNYAKLNNLIFGNTCNIYAETF